MSNKGLMYGIGAYLMWGFFPLYFKALQAVPALQIVFHRVIWSFLFLILVVLVKKEWPGFKNHATRPKAVLIYAVAATLLALNWLVYVYGVTSDQVVETSLGYFINPLVSVALGVIFLREQLRTTQWLPIGLAAVGVLYLTLQVGTLPWIALALAFTFGLYGLLKKVAPLGALHGLTLETAILFLPALLYLVYAERQGFGSFGHLSWMENLLMMLVGVVTAVPLLMFASAARAIPLFMIGLLQYIAPTCQFLLGVFVFHEPFTPVRMIGFAIIWAALVLYWVEGFLARRRQLESAPASST
jgi:chloramphenicol-sensitive protein RarD